MSFLGNNLKVHFAGSDGEEIFHAALKAADVHYRLYSCFGFIDKKTPQDDFALPENHIIKVQDREMNHVIQDSGLFTLMFGAGKNRKVDHDYLLQWQDKLIKFVEQNKLHCSVVEIDCQKLLGVDEAWFFRKRMKERLGNRQINVFHWEDGKDGFDKIIDFSDYIAISVPELRIVKPKQYKKIAVELAKYAKERKPQINIHMLGCTEYSMLKSISFCTTADSTSWLSGVRYGYFNDGKTKGHITKFKKELFEQRKQQVLNMFVLGSLSAYYASQSWDVFIFHKIKQKSERFKWVRNNVSTMTSQMIDTVVYASISFGIGLGWFFTDGMMPAFIGLCIGQYLLKAFLALCDTPIFYYLTRKRKDNETWQGIQKHLNGQPKRI